MAAVVLKGGPSGLSSMQESGAPDPKRRWQRRRDAEAEENDGYEHGRVMAGDWIG